MDKTEQHIIDIIDKNRDKIISLAKSIKGEKGFFEFDTAEKVKNAFFSLNIPMESGLARTGVKAEKHYSSGPKLALIGELDGVACPSHPLANPENGIAHACGHSAQLAAIYGAAIALCDKDIVEKLSGSAVFFAVPSEEYVSPVEELIQSGITEPAGKPELIKRGKFNDISAAVITHVHMLPSFERLILGFNTCCGFVAKTVTVKGVAAHAAAAPHCGVNALNAASLALNAIGLLRETFKESDCIRIHTNITKGGTALNVVPDEIVVKAMIRGINNEAINSAAEKFDNAFTHCALAIGAHAEIETQKGYSPTPYLPPHHVSKMSADALGIKKISALRDINYASTDVGYLTEVMPVIGFTHGGVEGALHSVDFKVIDENDTYILPAKMFALQAYHLLKNNAAELLTLRADFDEGKVM